MPVAVYQALAARWDAVIGAGVTTMVARAIDSNAELLTAMLTLYIIGLGIMLMFGKIDWGSFVFWAVRGAAVAMLLTAGAFADYIQVPLTETIPQWIARASGGGSIQSVPAAFDQLRFGVLAQEAKIMRELTGLSPSLIAARMTVSAVTTLTNIEIMLVFAMWQMMRGLMAFLVIVAPFLLGFFLFKSTRHIATNWAGAVISTLLGMLFLSILVSFSIVTNNAFMETVLTRTSSTFEEMIADLEAVFIFFLFSLLMCLFLPYLAMRIGNGVLPNINPILSGLGRRMTGGR